jgi:geranylgeranyl reductase family protein
MRSGVYDVAVVGAGPAGASAALRLAGAGLRVALLEKSALPRHKTCGGGLVQRAINRLPALPDALMHRACTTVDIHLLDHQRSYRVSRAVPVVYMTMRKELDYHLACAAANAGADLMTNCEAAEIHPEATRAVVRTNHGPVRSTFVIAADGATGTASRAAGRMRKQQAIPAVEQEMEVEAHVYDEFCRSARFDFGIVPNGYAWVFPKNGFLSAGVLTTRRGKTPLRHHLALYLNHLHIPVKRSLRLDGYIIPVRPVDATPQDGSRTLLAGDAAGFADPLTAEGISNAVLSAQLAADSLIEGQLIHRQVANLYREKIRTGLLSELKIARLLARLCYTNARWRNLMFDIAGDDFANLLTDVFAGSAGYQSQVKRLSNYNRLLARTVRSFARHS